MTDPMTRPGDVEPTVSDRDVLRAPALVDRDNADGLGEYADFRKVATTRISTFLMPPGTVYQTPEGLKAEDEDTRIAFDVQGGVYPIRESVFQASYVRGGPCDDQSCARCWDQDSRKYTR